MLDKEKGSLILENATKLRKKISDKDYSYPKFLTSSEVIRINTAEDLQEALENAYGNDGINNTVILCRSNKRANQYNQQIRVKNKMARK